MPVTFSGYPAPITTAQLGPNSGTGPSQNEFNQWQQIGSPMGPGGFPAYNAIYNVYGNSGAAAARNAQIGNGPAVNPATAAIPGVIGASPIQGPSASSFTQPGGPTGSGSNYLAPGPGVNYAVPGITPSTGSTSGAGGYASGAPPNLSSLTQLVDQLNLQGQQASNAGRIPGSAGLEAQSSANIGNELAGQVSPDVINLLQQQGAERGVGMGSPGSDNANAGYLRALGLTSLGQQQAGQQNLSAAYARNPGARVFDPTSQLLTPAQAGQLNNENAQLQLAWYKALNPGASGQGGNRGGGQTPTDPASGLPSWFPTVGGTPGMPSAPPSTVPGFDPTSLGFNPAAPTSTAPDTGSPYNYNNYDPLNQDPLNPAGTNFDIGSPNFDPTTYNPFAGYA